MSSIPQISASELKKWLEEEMLSFLGPLKEKGSDLLTDLRSKLDETQATSEKLFEDAEKEMRRGGSKTYRASRAANRLARNLSERIGKITIPSKVSYKGLCTLDTEIKEMLTLIGMERRRWFPHMEPYFIMNRRKLDNDFRKIVESADRVENFIRRDYEKAKVAEDKFFTIDNFVQLLNELNETEELKKRNISKIKAIEERIAKKQQKITSIHGKGEAHDLVEINIKIEELREKTKRNLRYLQKPFSKLRSLTREGGIQTQKDEVKKLGEFLSDPFEALATEEEGYPQLILILKKISQSMAQGKLKLKSSRLRKAQEQIDGILHKKIMSSLHQDCKKAHAQRQQLLMSEAIAAHQKELIQLEIDIKSMKGQLCFINSKDANLEGKVVKKLQKIQEQKQELENAVVELTGKRIEITI